MTRLRALLESFRDSLFYLPALFVLGAVGASEGLVALDHVLGAEGIPGFFESTVDSSRLVLSTIAGAVITVAGVVFSVMVISVQLASSQYSPRILRGFLRDRLEQVVMGFMVGTFTYALLVLRKVRGDETPGGEFVPHLSVSVGVLLGVAAALAILAFIDRAARMMQIGNLIGRVADETLETIRQRHPERGDGDTGGETLDAPEEPGFEVRAWENGWLQQVDDERLLDVLPSGGTVLVQARVGTFVTRGVPLCTIWPKPAEPNEIRGRIEDAVNVGGVRTMQQDVVFGIRQLTDVALRALSTGVNDPTTAHEVVAHLGAILRELLLRDLPPAVISGDEGRRVIHPKTLDHDAFVDRAFDQIREAGAGQSAVAIYLLKTLGMLRNEVESAGLPERTEVLRWHAGLVLAGCEAADPLPEDLERVRAAAEEAGVAPRGRKSTSR